jgi:hypothetical protein
VVGIENRAGNDATGPEHSHPAHTNRTYSLAVAVSKSGITEMMRAAVTQRLSALLPCRFSSNLDGYRMSSYSPTQTFATTMHRTQRLAPDAERTHAALTQTDAPPATICTRQDETKAGARLLASASTGMQKILCTGEATVKRGGSVRSGRVRGWLGRACKECASGGSSAPARRRGR